MRKLFAHAGGSLGGGPDGEQFGLPVGYNAMGFKCAVGLHLSGVPAIYDDVGIFESLLGITVFVHGRPMNVAGLGNVVRAAATARGSGLVGRAREYKR